MGRVLLIALVAVVLGGCEPAPEATGEPHAELACAACHSGPRGERGRASVPASSCQASGCHEAGGPEQVQIATVTFPHRDHAEGYEIDATCAGCHTHETGEAPLEASVEACALCHVGEVTSAEAAECRLCHQQPDHSSLTSQGVAVSHSQLPWIDIGCVRCHYDVAEADTDVSPLECRECHEDVGVLNARAVGRDLHPIHDGITCTACHRDDLHEVRAMSSAVALVCSDCHREAHEVALDVADPPSAMCAACHTGVHVPQQRLLLGIQPELGAQPGAHFVAGITCRSCHIPPAAPTEEPVDAIRGQAASCAGCHREEYPQVLDWWIEGIEARLAESGGYVERAARAVGGEDGSPELIREAVAMVTLVAEAGGQHNLELADRLLREAVTRAQLAYEEAGLVAPPPPNLGRAPHSGMCSYCHYSPDEPWDLEAMPEDFHREVLGPPQQ